MCSFLKIYRIDNNLVWLESMQMDTSSLRHAEDKLQWWMYEPDCA